MVPRPEFSYDVKSSVLFYPATLDTTLFNNVEIFALFAFVYNEIVGLRLYYFEPINKFELFIHFQFFQ